MPAPELKLVRVTLSEQVSVGFLSLVTRQQQGNTVSVLYVDHLVQPWYSKITKDHVSLLDLSQESSIAETDSKRIPPSPVYEGVSQRHSTGQQGVKSSRHTLHPLTPP